MHIKIKQTILLFSDIILLYVALAIMLLIKYGHITNTLLKMHIGPFSAVFVLWILSFYILGLYNLRTLKDKISFIQTLSIAVALSVVFSVMSFYTISYFNLTPKSNLAIFAIVFFILDATWRAFLMTTFKDPKRFALILGGGRDIEEMKKLISENPQLGYKISYQIVNTDGLTQKELDKIINQHNNINTIITSNQLYITNSLSDLMYKYISAGIEISSTSEIYELLFKKSPISKARYVQILTSVSKQHRIYQITKKPIDFSVAIILLVLLSPLMLAIMTIIKATSRGPVIYKQIRVGKNNKNFVLYKFRTMTDEIEENQTKLIEKNDSRITKIGRVLRYTHLDELPQLINIIKGDMCFVGPRPEKLEFVKYFRENIPYYDIRHLVRPGITGWAQINYKYTSSKPKEVSEKLQYDVYYIKNRSFILDILILISTLKTLIFNHR